MMRDRILLLLEHRGNRRLLAEWLKEGYDPIEGEGEAALSQPFDLCIVDGMALARMLGTIRSRKEAEQGVFLPVLAATSHHERGTGLRKITESVDELIGVPIEKAELAARVAMLLRARRFSLQNFALRRALEADLANAARVQAALLPDRPPSLHGFELAARCVPAREVGGDFYDWDIPSSDLLTFTLGDVCGKGMPAALLMATIRATLRAVSRQNGPAEALNLAQRALSVDFERSGRFVTLLHAQLDLSRRRLRYADAGHGHVFMRREDGSIEELDSRGVPLGAFFDQDYQEATMEFRPGDTLVVYSDGLIEVQGDRDAAEIRDRGQAELRQALDIEAVLGRLIGAARDAPSLPDDVTLMMLRCIGA